MRQERRQREEPAVVVAGAVGPHREVQAVEREARRGEGHEERGRREERAPRWGSTAGTERRQAQRERRQEREYGGLEHAATVNHNRAEL
jgi:hypothetical protein